jgi:ABC-type sugar transport system, periplasmic component
MRLACLFLGVMILYLSLAANTAAQPVEIVFWHMSWGAAYESALQEIVDAFEKENPDIKVRTEVVSWANYVQKFLTAVEGGVPPDVSEGSSYQPIIYAARGEVMPVDELIAKWQQTGQIDDLVSQNHRNYYMQGHYWAVPAQVDVRGIYYRKDMFADAGLAEPTTWDELYETAKKLTKDGVFGFSAQLNREHPAQQLLLTLMLQNGTSTFDAKGNLVFDNPRTVQAFEFYNRLFTDTMPPGSVGYDGDQARRVFLEGHSAMHFDSPAVIAAVEEAGLSDRVGVLPVLQGPSGDRGTAAWTNPVMIWRQTKHPEQALRWVEYLTRPENLGKLYNSGRYNLPVFRSQFNLPFITSSPVREEAVTKLLPFGHDYSYPGEATPLIPLIEEQYIWTDAVHKMLVEGMSPSDAVKWAATRIRHILADL